MAPDAGDHLDYLGVPPCSTTALATLSEPLQRWFRQRYGGPTPAQRFAWPAVAGRKNLLLSAPTGGGKTLAAFLPIVDRLLASYSRAVRCLYVAPLKALVNDAQRNLQTHLDDLRAFLPTETFLPHVRLRTGDSCARARRELYLQPPEILLTTPESLAVLLTQPFSTDLLGGLEWVVVDELHALAPSKRGTDLALSLERLDGLTSGRLQRIGLSATAAPLDEAARFLVGARRSCAVSRVADHAPLAITVEPLPPQGRFIDRLTQRLEPELLRNRTTLIFTNVRSLAERLGWALRCRYPAWAEQVAVHHSALAVARRREVEGQLKAGRLRAVVSSTSLELGIDIGPIEGVVLVHPPGDVVRLLQRVGRAGHGPGLPRRGLILTASPAELLDAAVTTAGSRSHQLEPLRVPLCPLDVLCQHLLGMAAQRAWRADEAYEVVRRAHPYRTLARYDFNACLDYLSGRRRDGQIWLPARLCWSGDEFSVIDERTARLVRRNLGTIIGEEPRPVTLKLAPIAVTEAEDDSSFLLPPASFRLVGHVDEPYAERLKPGDRFLLDGRCLEYRHVEGDALVVEDSVGRPQVPVWGGEGWPLAEELARRLFLLRLRAAEALRDGPVALAELFRREYGLDHAAVGLLVRYFQRQECVSEVPDTATCLVEVVAEEAGGGLYVHTPLNRRGNDALARVAVLRLARDCGQAAVSLVADLGFALFLTAAAEITPEEFRTLLAEKGFESDLATALRESQTLRERFRRVALTGLMVLRNPQGGRRRVGGRDWAQRRLFDHVATADPDFVLFRQALREVGADCCDAAAAQAHLRELPSKHVRFRRLPHVSPFAENWTQQDNGPFETLDSPSEALQRLHATLTRGATDHGSTCRLAADA